MVRDAHDGLVSSGGAPTWLARIGDRVAWYASSVGLHRYGRLGALPLVAVLLATQPLPPAWLVFWLLLVYVAGTAMLRHGTAIQLSDVVVGVALIVVYGARVVPFLPFLLVAVAHPAAKRGLLAGVAAGGGMATVLLFRLAIGGELAVLGLAETVPVALLLPLSGLTASAASELLEDRSVRDRLVLQQANRLLSSLRAIAADIPGGLDVSTVSAAVLAEVRALPDVRATAVLVEEAGRLVPATATGMGQRHVPSVAVEDARDLLTPPGRLHTPSSMPGGEDACWSSHRYWLAVALSDAGTLTGMLIVGFDDLEAGRGARARLASIAADGAIALENARLFDGTQTRAVDAARRQVAGDLHDGVAQSLAHLRMELELLAREAPKEREVQRLAGVAAGALDDLRSTITGLRTATDVDLEEALRLHLDAVRSSHGPELSLAAMGARRIDPERAAEVLRVAQEAISNALRHAEASSVLVSLEGDEHELLLVVEDDGRGLTSPSSQRGGNVGLASMRERADRLGGSLQVRERRGGGTVVSLTCPTQPQSVLPAIRSS